MALVVLVISSRDDRDNRSAISIDLSGRSIGVAMTENCLPILAHRGGLL